MSVLCTIIQKTIDKSFFIDATMTSSYEYWSQVYSNIKTFNAWEPKFFLYFYCSNLSYSKITNKNFIGKKYYYLKDILDNIFTSENFKKDFLLCFSKAQRTYFAFTKLANMYKHKRASIKMNVDLCMNELNPNKKNVITVLQCGSKYLFLASDLIRIVNSSLLNSCYFFAEPLQPKNPFNNIPFDNSTLYNIYFHIKYNCDNNPILFHLFFKANFDLDNFLHDNESYIRETNIKNYVKNSPPGDLYHDLKLMLSVNRRYTKKLLIHNEVPVEKLVDIFRPYFHLFYLHKYGVYGTEKRNKSLIQLKTKLRAFVEYNSLFGRKIYKSEKSFAKPMCNKTSIIKTTRTFSFNLDHINFYKNNTNSPNNTQYNISFARFNSPSFEEIYYNNSEEENSLDDDDEDDYDEDDSIRTEIPTLTPVNQQVVGVEFFINEESESDSIS